MAEEICWVEEFTGSKPNFTIKYYSHESGTIFDVREIPAIDYGTAAKWAVENSPGECGCLIVPM